MKVCTACEKEKPLIEFPVHSRRPGWYGPKCKSCLYDARWPQSINARQQQKILATLGVKGCGKCKQVKPLSQFHKMAASADGLAFKCRACANTDSANWRESNPDANAEWCAKNKQYNSARFKVWREENKEYVTQRIAQWAKDNPHKVNALIAKRSAAKKRATPAWADQAAIERFYADAVRLTKETGERHEVDHIVPLQGKTVRGLHWEGNLQVLPKIVNIAKLNRNWPDMPC